MPGADEIASAAQRGEEEARALDLRLRATERRERAARLGLLAGSGSDVPALSAAPPSADSYTVEQLRRQVAELAEFQRAVLRSKGWRLLQSLRRPFGRSW